MVHTNPQQEPGKQRNLLCACVENPALYKPDPQWFREPYSSSVWAPLKPQTPSLSPFLSTLFSVKLFFWMFHVLSWFLSWGEGSRNPYVSDKSTRKYWLLIHFFSTFDKNTTYRRGFGRIVKGSGHPHLGHMQQLRRSESKSQGSLSNVKLFGLNMLVDSWHWKGMCSLRLYSYSKMGRVVESLRSVLHTNFPNITKHIQVGHISQYIKYFQRNLWLC